MASISKRPDGRWRARYRDANGKEHAKHFNRKADAQRWVDEITAAIITGQYVDPNAGKTTFKEYATGWEASQVTGEAQRRIVDNALRVHLIRLWVRVRSPRSNEPTSKDASSSWTSGSGRARLGTSSRYSDGSFRRPSTTE